MAADPERLYDLYANLPAPDTSTQSNNLSAIRLDKSGVLHLAKDAHGLPVVLVETFASGQWLPSVELKNFTVAHSVRCSVSTIEGSVTEDEFSIMRCNSTLPAIQRIFLRFMARIEKIVDGPLTPSTMTEAIESLSRLFLSIQKPKPSFSAGLWAELLVILFSSNPKEMLRSWHVDTTGRYDFSLGNQHLEIKSTRGEQRHHVCSYEQLAPAQGIEVVLCSLRLEQSSTGPSLGDYWDQALELVSDEPEMQNKVDYVCAGALGDAMEEGRTVCFDETEALRSLQFFHIDRIPALRAPLPVGVFNVRYSIDLEGAAPLRLDEVKRFGQLFSHAVPVGEQQ